MQRFACLIITVSLAAAGIAQEITPPSAATAASTDHAEESLVPPTVTPPIELKADASGVVPQEQIRELLKRSATRDLENDKQLRDYTYVQRQETRKLDGKGQVKKVELVTSEILQIAGEQVQRVIARNDQPLSEKDAKKEEEKIQKIIDKRKNESDEDRRKRQEREDKNREDERKFVLEIADAYNFRLVRSEMVDGRDTWVLDAEPRPGYEPKSKETKFLTKVKGRLWIDKENAQWAKIDATIIDTISFGLVLARIHMGTHILIDQTRVNEEVWLPKHVTLHVDARVALLKNFDEDIDVTYRDYKKFRSESKITVVGETQ